VVSIVTSMGGSQASRIPTDHDTTLDDPKHIVGTRHSAMAPERADVRDLSCSVRCVTAPSSSSTRTTATW